MTLRIFAKNTLVSAVDPKKLIGWFVGLVGTVSAVYSLAFMDSFPGKNYVLIAVTVVSVALLGLASWRYMMPRHLLRTECDISEADADVTCALGDRIYTQVLRKPYPTRDQLDGWLHRYNRGVCHVYDERNKIWGYTSLWPITAEAFSRLKTGEISESDLEGSMVAPREDAPFSHWYVADIVRDNQRFDSRVPNVQFAEYIKPLMIHACLKRLHKDRQFAPSFEIIGLAVTRPGERMLKQEFQFERVLPLHPYQPTHKIYLRAFTTASLRRLLAHLRREIDRSEREIREML